MAKMFTAHLGPELNDKFAKLAQRAGTNRVAFLEQLIEQGDKQLDALEKRAGAEVKEIEARLVLRQKVA